MSARKKIPSSIEREILFKNEACCCICGKQNVQIHHIDGNNSNNKMDNLAVLCIEHHGEASSKPSMTKHLSSELVKKFKLTWEERTLKRREIIKKQNTYKKEDKSFINFEIKKLIYSLPAFPNKSETNSIIEQLYIWNLLSGHIKEILDNFSLIRWFLKSPQISIIFERIWEFFWHFVGPDKVKMNKENEKEIVMAVELIGDLGTQIIILEENPKFFEGFFEAIEHFKDIAFWYKSASIKKSLKKELNSLKNDLREAKKYPSRQKFINKIDEMVKKI